MMSSRSSAHALATDRSRDAQRGARSADGIVGCRRGQSAVALEQRQIADVLAVEAQQDEGEERDQSAAVAQVVEHGATLVIQADDLAVEDRVLGFDDVGFRTLHEGDDFVVFGLGNVERLQRGVGVVEEDRPIAFADAHSLMGELHVTALVVQRAAATGAEKINGGSLRNIASARIPKA